MWATLCSHFNFVEEVNSNEIDSIISAEIQNPIEDRPLYEMVNETYGPCSLVHVLCDALNKNSPCTKDNMCTKRYHRGVLQDMQTGEDEYEPYKN